MKISKFSFITGVRDFMAGVIFHPNLYSIRSKISAFHSRHFFFEKMSLCERGVVQLTLTLMWEENQNGEGFFVNFDKNYGLTFLWVPQAKNLKFYKQNFEYVKF